MATKLFLTKRELMAAIGISIATVNRHLACGLIPAVKIGGKVLIPISFIENLTTLAADGGAK